MKTDLLAVPRGFLSLLTGMRVTLTQFFRPIVTVQYPRQTLKIPARFRGHIELILDPQTGRSRCTAQAGRWHDRRHPATTTVPARR